MRILTKFILITVLSSCLCLNEEHVLQTEIFQITINPSMFNWTYEGSADQYKYDVTLADAPDLPSWLRFVYSQRHRTGFVYGVAPVGKTNITLDVIALNRRTYETKIEQIKINIADKLNPALFEVHLKIDNVNVVDMFDPERMEALKDIFRKILWKDSGSDLYVTYMNSALDIGARKPPNPTEEEGVVIKLGSQEPFSTELLELQEEIRPLWKVPVCPRDFKRTSVERHFRSAGFALDWCMFRLIGDNNSAIGVNEKLLYQEPNDVEIDTISRYEIPTRDYFNEYLVSTLVPISINVVLVCLVSFIICAKHEALDNEHEESREREEPGQFEYMNSEPLYAINRDMSLSPEPALFSLTNSPTSTLNHHGVHCRPSPPPYVRPKFKPEL
ncbi:epsilon-sarcoglycan isoform X2 [Aethina tumida]|uniref:epsilon-sarcoglycan isoform X2 n=1 Tax=Aethina tumida TaxID=116153 RepID=UPI002148D89F|nr:epsilon-sarcoglycan isoform X2 [Aethina tumida]